MDNVSVQCENCEEIVQPEGPEGARKWKLVGAAILGFFGFAIGSVVGIATAGFGFVASFVTVPLGLYFGWKMGAKFAEMRSGITCPNCGNDFSRSAEQLEKAGAAASKARKGASNAAGSARDAVDERRGNDDSA